MSSDGEGGNNEVEVNAKQEKVKKDTGQREEAKVVFDPYADVEISASALMFVDRLRKNVSRYYPYDKIGNIVTFVTIRRFPGHDR